MNDTEPSAQVGGAEQESGDPAVPVALFPIRRRRRLLRVMTAVVTVAVVGLATVLAQGLDITQTADSPLLGKPAPPFSLASLDGDASVSSEQFAGHIVVVNFWASWCVPCRKEAPILESFWERWASQGVVLVGILYGDTPTNGRDFRDEFGLTYPQADDRDGRTSIDYGVRGVPETFVISPGGLVMARIIGAVGPTTLDDVVSRVLAGQTFTSTNGDYLPGPAPDTPFTSPP